MANTKVLVRAYTSPTLVLLAFDWPSGRNRQDFLGFAIERTPGFWNTEAKSWLPNRLTFDGPTPNGVDTPTNQSPIQKLLWWDARIDTDDRGKTFKYRVIPVTGSPGALALLQTDATEISVPIPELEVEGVGTYFNRAVMSSQAFARHFPTLDTLQSIKNAYTWLANGMDQAIPSFLTKAKNDAVEGAIYHLNDDVWTLPALTAFPIGKLKLAYNHTSKDDESDAAIDTIISAGHPSGNFAARTHANISHNKFLVRVKNGNAKSVLMGSANFTTAGLTRQANVLHTFGSPKLAKHYLDRARLLAGNPFLKDISAGSDWSPVIDDIPGAEIRVFFSPEKKPERISIDRIVSAVQAAESSVIFCCFMPTDMPIINACLAAGDTGKMMYGLVDNAKEPGEDNSSYESKIALYHRSRDNRDVAGKEAFNGDALPGGFLSEREGWPNEDPARAVRIHHKFVLIDAETDRPILYTGSANLSSNSLYKNDENLLEIIGHTGLARAYLAEFMRLYEHYRARLVYVRSLHQTLNTFKLLPTAAWAAKYYRNGSPESRARIAMVGDAD